MHEDRHTDTGTQLCKAVTPQTACSAHLQTPACSCAALQGDVHCHRGLQTCTRFHLQSLPLPLQAGKHVGISASTQFCIYTCVCAYMYNMCSYKTGVRTQHIHIRAIFPGEKKKEKNEEKKYCLYNYQALISLYVASCSIPPQTAFWEFVLQCI